MTTRRAFTVIELLVVVSIIALLVGILLPAIGKARDQARVTISQANLRNLATAHASYAAEWSDRQYTLIDDNIAFYGSSTGAAFDGYIDSHGGGSGINNPANHPPVYLGYGHDHDGNTFRMFAYKCNRGQVANAALTQPIVFGGGLGYFGSFRIPNAQQFTQYTNGRFYDPIFYAPKDTNAIHSAQPCLDAPDDFCDLAIVRTDLGDIPAWSSYCLSPAAMFNPKVMRHDDTGDPTANGWVSPWTLTAGFRSPAFSQSEYPNLKTHMLEHHWLQNVAVDCNPGFSPAPTTGASRTTSTTRGCRHRSRCSTTVTSAASVYGTRCGPTAACGPRPARTTGDCGAGTRCSAPTATCTRSGTTRRRRASTSSRRTGFAGGM